MSEDNEVTAAAVAAQKTDPAGRTRQWLLETSVATLGTLAKKRGVDGYPYGSVVPFALTAEGHPYVLIARIATHTANLKADPRASLFVRQPAVDGDPQAGWRVTLMGEMTEVSADDPRLPELDARYRERVPQAADYRSTHNFSFYEMREVVKVKYIAGFGEICWFDGSQLTRDPAGAGLAEAAEGAISHMNEDHAHNLKEMIRGFEGKEVDHAEMVGIDRTGMLVRTGPERLSHFSFGKEISSATLRKEVIGVLTRARGVTP